MAIQKISQTLGIDRRDVNNHSKTNQITFGYNKALNQELKTVLTNNSTDLFKQIASLNEFCNTTEEALERSLAKKAPITETSPLTGILIDAKCTLVAAIEEHFPFLNYGKREVSQYEKRAMTTKTEWLQDLVDEIKAETGEFEETSSDTVARAYGRKNAETILGEYKANSSSPKGLISLGGMDELKQRLNDKIIFPIKSPEEAKLDEIEYGKKFPRATLLFGPPGCGKTYVAEAIAREADVPFFKLKISQLGSEYQNKTSNNFEKLFSDIEGQSKETGKPCILFIDEIEGLTKNRGRNDEAEELKQIGTLLDLIGTARERGIIVIGATNKYDLVDEAIKNRFDYQDFIGLPDTKTIKEVIKLSLQGRSKAVDLLQSDEALTNIAEKMQGFSNRTICDLSEHAALRARNDNRRNITAEDYLKVIESSQHLKIKDGNVGYKPTVSREAGLVKLESKAH